MLKTSTDGLDHSLPEASCYNILGTRNSAYCCISCFQVIPFPCLYAGSNKNDTIKEYTLRPSVSLSAPLKLVHRSLETCGPPLIVDVPLH